MPQVICRSRVALSELIFPFGPDSSAQPSTLDGLGGLPKRTKRLQIVSFFLLLRPGFRDLHHFGHSAIPSKNGSKEARSMRARC